MESNRSSPLSTLIMILPLIVVPGLAILRPAEHDNGFVSDDLNAAAQGMEFSEFEPTVGAGDSFSRLLDSPPSRPRSAASRLDAPMARLDAPLAEDWRSPSETHGAATGRTAPNRTAGGAITQPSNRLTDSASAAAPHAALLENLRIAGATRTMWFRPGGTGDVGFIAFLPGDGNMVSYRFEAIASSESDAIRDVVRQVRRWQQQQAPPSSSER